MKKMLTRFIRDDRGASAIEYGLIAGLIALAIAASAGTLGDNLKNGFSNLATRVAAWLPGTGGTPTP
ncbi:MULTISPECIES: Flp family type IVb pilin [Cupriavidus]|uniref:Flp/Fap pilin component n=1 Tax=Cupriavidus pinatubonensis (strain JMP 134 / LMG 1197) TaxID=264198 RepID=Q46Q34_CUPPJ|nr:MULTISPECIES: Flp family type IVb pilin [Cupriavidus]QYY27635.1 Flp family type IVb pilin [Cupriavidus pinatubonensis]TPQ37780.1 Flp family type IVb pilin [Cupriavidus pinatubonensis]